MPTTIDESTKSADGILSVTVRCEPLTIDLNTQKMGTVISAAIATEIQKGIQGISVLSANGKHRAFNNTGTLANGITVSASGNSFDIVPPSGYLENDATMQKLIALVPVISDPLSASAVEEAILHALADSFVLGALG